MEKTIVDESEQKNKQFETYPLLDTDSINLCKIEKKPTIEDVLIKSFPMINIDYKDIFQWKSKLETKYKKMQTNDIFQLIPNRGSLKPYETQNIQVIFRPTFDVNVKAILECNVLGGPSETITVTGLSSNLRYMLNTEKINFKIRSFHENAFEELIITNTALLPFGYKVYVNQPKLKNAMEGNIVEIEPPEKNVEPEEAVNIKVIVKPGLVGYFHRVFLLEIGHLPHLPIEIAGWGVIPQMYLFLKRSNFINVCTI